MNEEELKEKLNLLNREDICNLLSNTLKVLSTKLKEEGFSDSIHIVGSVECGCVYIEINDLSNNHNHI